MFGTHGYISISAAFTINSAEQSICINIPGKSGKFIYCRKNDGGTFAIYFFVHHINRDWDSVIPVPIKLAILIRAVYFNGLSVCIDIEILFLKRLSAEWTSQQLFIYMISGSSGSLWVVCLLNKVIEFIRRYTASNPETYTDRLLTKARVSLASDHLSSHYHFGNSVPLLSCKQA